MGRGGAGEINWGRWRCGGGEIVGIGLDWIGSDPGREREGRETTEKVQYLVLLVLYIQFLYVALQVPFDFWPHTSKSFFRAAEDRSLPTESFKE